METSLVKRDCFNFERNAVQVQAAPADMLLTAKAG